MVLTSTILLKDKSYYNNHFQQLKQMITDIIDRYDYESYEHVCHLIEALYFSKFTTYSQQNLQLLSCELESLLDNMIHNL